MTRKSTIYDCHIVELKKIHNRAGNITSIEGNLDLPFGIKRVYYLYDVPGGAERGGHAHRELHQLIVAASGCFDIVLADGNNKKIIELNRPYFGLYVVPGIWREIINFSSGAICLVMASHKYDESDYIRNFDNFLSFRQDG
jgi:hypothetical protein